MNNNLEHLADNIIAVAALLVGLTGFFYINSEFMYQESTAQLFSRQTSYREDLIFEQRVIVVSGADVIKNIYNGNDGIRYQFYDDASPRNLIAEIVGSETLFNLSMISITDYYSVEYTITGGTIIEVKYMLE